MNEAGAGSKTHIFACDTDINSIAIASDNAVLNDVVDSIDFQIGSISEETPCFDFVCANLTLDVIVPNLSLLLEKMGRTLVMSGILVEQEAEIVAELTAKGVQHVRIERAGEWIAVTVVNKRS
jgi:ribosomal protein L11 methylase PrmA